MSENKRLDAIRGLLALAENQAGTPEGEAASERANSMMIKYQVNAALLDATADKPDYIVTDHVITVHAPYAKTKASLINNVANVLGVKIVQLHSYDRSVTPLSVIGFSKDIELLEMLYTSLLVQSQLEMARAERDGMWDAWGRKINAKTWRTSFQYGYVMRVTARLSSIYKAAVDETPGTGLVLVDRSKEVDLAVKNKFEKLRKTPGGSARSAAGYGAGQKAANKADLGQSRFRAQTYIN